MATDHHLDDDAIARAASDAASIGQARAHLATCDACRARYDEHVRLLRALAGDPSSATRAEDDAIVARVLARSHAATHAPVPARTLSRRTMIAAPVALAAAAACV